ncbi:MAG: nucleotidyl transferase AbiEii/AbiGii toxin family protein [Candidatus Diapherotrites archaeon]
MISIEELRFMAKKNGIQSYFQEKDYLQNVFLFNLFKETDKMIFKGGIALKIMFNYPRFSEDLDFNSNLNPKKIKELVRKALKQSSLLGLNYSFVKEELFKEAYTAKIRFEGPLFVGRIESTNTISIDAEKRTELHLKPEWRQAIQDYTDIPRYFVLVMQEKEIFAEKIRAMYARGKARDFLDVWLMIQNKVEFNKRLTEKKFREAGKRMRSLNFCGRKEFEQELRGLIYRAPDYEQVKKEIKGFLKGKIKQ